MRQWQLAIALDPRSGAPLFLQLADAIAEAIRDGRLRSGEALPGTRDLATRLGLNRNTVVAAYDELAAEGVLRTRIGGGTFVEGAPASPRAPAARTAADLLPTYAIAPAASLPRAAPLPAGALQLGNALPDARLFPARELARAFRRAIGRRGHAMLAAGDACGHPRLRAALATMLAHSRGLAATVDNVMVTRCVEQGIDLVARALLAPGDAVAVEAFGYPPAWTALRQAGARLHPLPLDGEGLRVDALESLLARMPLRALFLTPHHQFPTTAVMSAPRRARLAALALRHRFAIIEDDYDHEYHYAGKPVLPLAAGRGAANVVYVGSLANLLAPGIGSGFVVAPPPVFARIAELRAASDPRCDAAVECALAELFEDGEMLRHVRRTRQAYMARRDALAASLRKRLGDALAFRVPEGGLGLWARAADDIDVDAWSREGACDGVQFQCGGRYDLLQRERHCLRLAFSALDATELDDAVARMARALARVQSPRGRIEAGAYARRPVPAQHVPLRAHGT